MLRLALKLLLFIPLLLVVGLVNYTVDPSQLFGSGRVESRMAQIMLSGQNVSNIANFDHRLLQKAYFAEMEQPADIVVLGSSRSMLLNSAMFPEQSFYNASLAGTSIEDYVALYEMMPERNLLPNTVILEISPWVFNRNSDQTRWKSLGPEYLDGLASLGQQPTFKENLDGFDFQRYSALFSLSYLQESLRWITRSVDFYATDLANTGEDMKLNDGSRVYNSDAENRSEQELADLVAEGLAQPYSLANFEQIDPWIAGTFEDLVDAFEADGVEVVILLVPYHPVYYASLMESAEYHVIDSVEIFLNAFAGEHNLTIFGSYNPEALGCISSEYYDGLHPKISCIEKIGVILP